ncbi:hypothetical protein DM860_004195 [Cuscuta australis]|uniref:F-box associated beta-propeller type 3 domain-containing protein n=1 Tax=Cuscuta australis TaxID=267555 RepID=A0A328D066_9ASTE|nr:hypothetical protein DM860_004195 [Cuscuta australis]
MLAQSMGFGFGRFASSITRCLPFFSTTVRSPLSCYPGGPGVFGPLAQILRRRAINGRRAYDANNFGEPCPGDFGLPDDVHVSETKCSSCLELWKADICPKPKTEHDIFVYFHTISQNDREYFVAYDSLKEDGPISPKYRIYAPPFPPKSHVLWNPTTSEYKILPNPFLELPPGLEHSSVANGMWSDPRFENYKLLHLVRSWFKDEPGMLVNESYHHIHLYSLKTNSWRRIPCTEFVSIERNNCTCISGVFYAAAFQNEACSGVILSFDFSTETLSTLPLPNHNCNRFLLLEYKGLLSALECWVDDDDDESFDPPCDFELWIMSDGSWTKESIFHTRCISEPSHFSPDGKLLYFVSFTIGFDLVAFDRAIGKLKHLGVNNPLSYPMMIPFVESFVQLNGISCMQEIR